MDKIEEGRRRILRLVYICRTRCHEARQGTGLIGDRRPSRYNRKGNQQRSEPCSLHHEWLCHCGRNLRQTVVETCEGVCPKDRRRFRGPGRHGLHRTSCHCANRKDRVVWPGGSETKDNPLLARRHTSSPQRYLLLYHRLVSQLLPP